MTTSGVTQSVPTPKKVQLEDLNSYFVNFDPKSVVPPTQKPLRRAA